MGPPLQLVLADKSPITLRPEAWLYLGAEVLKTKNGEPDWYECVMVLVGGTAITVRGRHEGILRALWGLEPAAVPSWWPRTPSGDIIQG